MASHDDGLVGAPTVERLIHDTGVGVDRVNSRSGSADRSKYDTNHFAYVASLSQIDVIITDSALPDEAAAALEAAGPTVVRI